MIPETQDQNEKWRNEALTNDAQAKRKMKAEYNETSIKVGDKVLIKLKKQRKDTPAWERKPYTVIVVNGSMVTSSRPKYITTRKMYRSSNDIAK